MVTVSKSVVNPDGTDQMFGQDGYMSDRREDPRSAPAAGSPLRAQLPVVLGAIRHPTMRRWSNELLAGDPERWTVAEPEPDELLVDAIARTKPEVVVVDTVDFPACCLAALDALPPGHVVVIGPEPDPGYRSAALAQGAAAWVSREHVGDELATAVHAALGDPNPISPAAVAVPGPDRPGSAAPRFIDPGPHPPDKELNRHV